MARSRTGEELTLGCLTQLTEHVKRALEEAGRVFDEPELYESTKNNTTVFKIECHIELEKPFTASEVAIFVRARSKRPKLARRPHLAHYHGGGRFTFNAAEQASLFDEEDLRGRPH
jgi:hypothetical protein